MNHQPDGHLLENTSGQGENATVPAGIERWNWGAFLLTWIWGIGNNTLIALLVFAPLANLVMPFVLGAKGSAWAWRNKRWDSVAAFEATQRKWALWGAVVFGAVLVLGVSLVAATLAMLKHSDAYRLGVRTLVEADHDAMAVLGRPITTGIPGGSFRTGGPDGDASLSFHAEGPRGEGTVYLEATKSLGEWKIVSAVFEDARNGRRIDLAD